MSANKIRVGVIGVGRMGERHCRIYSALAGVEFVGVGDVSPERGNAIARHYGVEWYEDYAELLSHVDAVTVATPTDSHLPVVAECLRRQVHVLVEKPMVSTVAEAREVVRLASQASAVVQVGHIERYNPVFLELDSILEDLQVVAFSARRLSPLDTSITDVDVVLDLMIHDIDLVIALLGDRVEHIQAYGRSARMASADFVVATLSLEGGPIATLTASRVTEQKVRQIEITALGAYIEADLLNKSICIYRRMLPEFISNSHKPLRYRQEGFVEQIHIPTAEPLLLEVADFVRCVREGCRPKVSAEDGLNALEIATSIQDLVGALDGGRKVGSLATSNGLPSLLHHHAVTAAP